MPKSNVYFRGIEEEERKENQSETVENNSKIVNIFLFVLGMIGTIVFWYMMWNYDIIISNHNTNIPFLTYFPIIVFLWGKCVLIVFGIINYLIKSFICKKSD